jgi:hypothetical protein
MPEGQIYKRGRPAGKNAGEAEPQRSPAGLLSVKCRESKAGPKPLASVAG